jgi:chromosome segregation ATPase
MAQAIVSQEGVAAVADQLVAAGEKPTMIRVREILGGGSYSTIKSYLDAWKQERQLTTAPASDLPPELAAKGEELLRSVWQIAMSLAEQQITQVRSEAQRQVAEARSDVQQLEAALTQQEHEQAAQAQQLAEQATQLKQLEAQCSELQLTLRTAETRASELDERVSDLKDERDTAHQEAATLKQDLHQAREQLQTTQIDKGGLEGELRALREQLRARDDLIERMANRQGAEQL